MGDFHIVVRHALTGIVLLTFTLCGLWIADPNMVHNVVGYILENFQMTSAILATPVLGVLVQGIYTSGLYVFDNAFTDSARRLAAKRVRQAVHSRMQAKYCNAFNKMPDDSIIWMLNPI